MMYDKFFTRSNARFFRMEPGITRADIERVLGELATRPNYIRQGARTIRRVEDTPVGRAKASMAVFLVEQEPPFLQGSRIVEQRGAFIFLVEFGGYLAVFYRNIGDIGALLPRCLVELPHSTITCVLAGTDTKYERLNLKSMSIAKSVIRARTIEADDLTGLMSNIAARRSVPQGLRYTSKNGSVTVRPSVSRIQQQSPRRTASQLTAWATEIIYDIPRASVRTVDFLQHFPQPITLAEKPDHVVPSGVLLQFDELISLIEANELRLLVGPTKDGALPPPTLDPAIQLLTELSAVANVDVDFGIRWSGQLGGNLVAHSVKYGLRSDSLRYIVIEEPSSGKRKTLPGWLGAFQNFIVTFSDPSFAYVGGTLFRDKGLVQGADLVLRVLDTNWPVGGCTSEKGLNARGDAHDQVASLFGVTEANLQRDVPWLICDDMGDEWADYIAVDDSDASPRLSFYHCKAGKPGLSASMFHDVVSQALKNLGRLFPAPDEVSRKARNWAVDLATGPPRYVPTTITSATTNIEAAFARVNSAPQTVREVVLVVNFLSKGDIKDAFDRVSAGTHVEPASVQLLWLLSSFAHACLEVGASPKVRCLP